MGFDTGEVEEDVASFGEGDSFGKILTDVDGVGAEECCAWYWYRFNRSCKLVDSCSALSSAGRDEALLCSISLIGVFAAVDYFYFVQFLMCSYVSMQ